LKASTSHKRNFSDLKLKMPRRPANFTQADVARAIRAAKQAGAEAVEVRADGTIIVLLKNPPIAPEEVPESATREIICETCPDPARHACTAK